MSRLRVAMIFGGRSVEHEVSVITAHQAMAALPSDHYEIIPIYISKAGQWFTGDALRKLENFRDLDTLIEMVEPVTGSVNATQPGLLHQHISERRGWLSGRTVQSQSTIESFDVAFPLLHGTHGEDGTIQGLFELANLPYVGSSVAASAVAMDKVLTKRVLRSVGIPVLDDIYVSRKQWASMPASIVSEAEARFGYPVFVKPVTLGSSIGLSRADDAASLRFALDVAATYDTRLMIEPAVQDIIEINCSVLGDGLDARPSICEQPVVEGVLGYEEKYLQHDSSKSKGMASTKRLIPAPIAPELAEAIQKTAVQAFAAIGASGVVRIDFLVQPADNTFFVNEINPIPGALSFYLWEPSGVPFPELLETLIQLALARHEEKLHRTFSFESSLLRLNPLLGAKSGKKIGKGR